MSGHGGKRKGAGRKIIIDEQELLWLGAECEQIWNDYEKTRQEQFLNAIYEKSGTLQDIREEQNALNQFSLQKREAWAAAGFPNYDDLDGNPDNTIPDFIENINIARAYYKASKGHALNVISVKIPGRYRGVRELRKTIIQAVTKRAQDAIGPHITESVVNEAWAEFKSINQKLKNE